MITLKKFLKKLDKIDCKSNRQINKVKKVLHNFLNDEGELNYKGYYYNIERKTVYDCSKGTIASVSIKEMIDILKTIVVDYTASVKLKRDYSIQLKKLLESTNGEEKNGREEKN